MIDHLFQNQIHPKYKRLFFNPEIGIIIAPKSINHLN